MGFVLHVIQNSMFETIHVISESPVSIFFPPFQITHTFLFSDFLTVDVHFMIRFQPMQSPLFFPF